jgi:hypothetical protein
MQLLARSAGNCMQPNARGLWDCATAYSACATKFFQHFFFLELFFSNKHFYDLSFMKISTRSAGNCMQPGAG